MTGERTGERTSERGRQPVEAVVIGVSAGGLEAVGRLLDGLPAGYRLPLILVQHLPEHFPSQLADIFRRKTRLPVSEAQDKLRPSRGLYIAPAGYHLLIEASGDFALSLDERVNFSRPSIDVLFDSAADAWGQRLAGILLTGANADGAAGLARIAAEGGLTVVQDPAEALVDTMPRAALALFQPDFVLPLAGIRQLLIHLDA